MNKNRDFMNKQTIRNGQGSLIVCPQPLPNSNRTMHYTSGVVTETPKVERDDGGTQDQDKLTRHHESWGPHQDL